MKRNSKGQFIKGTNGRTFEGFGVWNDAKGYPSIWIDGKTIKVHVFAWEREFGRKPKGYELHHIDFNKDNYSLDNLELLSLSDHKKIHSGWLRIDGKWIKKPCNRCQQILELDNFYPRKGYTPSALCKRCHNEVISIRNASPQKQEKLKQYKREWYQKRKVMPNAKRD